MSLKFGDKITLTVSPKLVLEIAGRTEKLFKEISHSGGYIDCEEVSIMFAQNIVCLLGEQAAELADKDPASAKASPACVETSADKEEGAEQS